MVMSAEIPGECPFSFLFIPQIPARSEASKYDPRESSAPSTAPGWNVDVNPWPGPRRARAGACWLALERIPLGNLQRALSPGRSCVPSIPTASRLAASSPRTWTIVGAIWVVSTGPGTVGDLLLAPRIHHTAVRHHDDVRCATVGQRIVEHQGQCPASEDFSDRRPRRTRLQRRDCAERLALIGQPQQRDVLHA